MKFQSIFSLVAVALLTVRAAPVSHSEITAKAAQGLRLLSLSEDSEPVWRTEEQMFDLIRQNINFFDVTETYELERNMAKSKLKAFAAVDFPAPSHKDEILPIIDSIKVENLQAYLRDLSNFHTRYYRSDTGAAASEWIRTTLRGIAANRADVSIHEFKHSWVQSSTILKIAGTSGSTGPVTIIGGHMDSINQRNPRTGRSPGADDDGSGSVVIMEAFRALVAADFKPTNPVEFHWYAGEEGGLLGSQAIAAEYKKTGVNVGSYMQLDMTAYPGSSPSISLVTDNTDAGLNDFVKQLVTTYTKVPVTTTRCGYACSDHASWTKNGFRATMPFEAPMGKDNPKIHTDGDTVDAPGFSWEHAHEFVKLAVSYIYERAV
ncbi:hypothetical protein HGRIS_003900 [Hohenbuehelia grisea]|uniref:Peptide hydrolase n=1 Tax=Hohenbuehelia grisea TaxID=104357 RepID=A0ABR3JIK6_9AGAR